MTTNDAYYAIFDTREPEGNGLAMRDEDGELILFDEHGMARSWLARQSMDPSRFIIIVLDEDSHADELR